jgi:hypothetical protein
MKETQKRLFNVVAGLSLGIASTGCNLPSPNTFGAIPVMEGERTSDVVFSTKGYGQKVEPFNVCVYTKEGQLKEGVITEFITVNGQDGDRTPRISSDSITTELKWDDFADTFTKISKKDPSGYSPLEGRIADISNREDISSITINRTNGKVERNGKTRDYNNCPPIGNIFTKSNTK